MTQAEGEQKPEDKPSRLSKEQLIWLNCLILALVVGRIGMGHYTFANEQLERYATIISALLFVSLAVIVSMGPKSKIRTISLVLTVPMAIIGSIGACLAAINWDLNEHPDGVGLIAQTEDVTFELVTKFDVSYDEICRQCIELRMVRTVLSGLLKETETLIEVRPAEDAKAELIDDGRKIYFTSPALLGRKAIVRTFSTNWVEARKNGYEIIELTKQEQKN